MWHVLDMRKLGHGSVWPDDHCAMTSRDQKSRRAVATLTRRTSDGMRRPPMKRTWVILMMCAALATPMMASAGDQTIPPEAYWTPTPPMRSTVDVNQLASMLVEKGM